MSETTFIDSVVSVRRVTKVTKGGKRFSFSAFVVSGDGKGKVGIGLGKSRDVSAAIAKATTRARKTMFDVPLRGTTLPYGVKGRHGASFVVLCPASKGTGLIAGGAIRAVLKALGAIDVLAKSIGPSACGQNLVKATLNALAKTRSAAHIARLRGKTIEAIAKGSHGSVA
ncbi:TPA: 30S ribosomal protein S5 [Candidatus Dependentiae bacterium]|nr:MAG: 30S ribosomal protein S5 [candidate division TM6 bacterium GW2011_GWF2_43_87]HBL98449.1 30S ribosomal protein S5 [Candidatus Dependentiae bacterium]